MADIHDYNNRVKNAHTNIQESDDISPENTEDAAQFFRLRYASNLRMIEAGNMARSMEID